jgi:hypothetical protein
MILGLVGKLLITRRFPMHKKYVVRLSDEERGVCQEIIAEVSSRADAAQNRCGWAIMVRYQDC